MFAAGLVGPDKGSFADLVGPDGGSDVGFGGTAFGLQTAIFPRWLSSISALCGAELIENELKTKRMQPKFRRKKHLRRCLSTEHLFRFCLRPG